MKDIKTRESKRDIKTLDRAAGLAKVTKNLRSQQPQFYRFGRSEHFSAERNGIFPHSGVRRYERNSVSRYFTNIVSAVIRYA